MANIFGRYVWLIEQFRQYGRLTYEEISRHWEESGLGYGDPLPKRTFHNHREAIFDIFQVEILCDPKDGYRYYIDGAEELEQDHLRTWLLDSYTALNQIQADSKLQGRILFEDVPYLQSLSSAPIPWRPGGGATASICTKGDGELCQDPQ